MRIEIVDESETGLMIEAAEAELARLERERDALPSAMASAARSADAATLRELKHRRGVIEDEAFGARVRLLRLNLQAEEQCQAALQNELSTQDAELVRATGEAQQLQDRANEALTKRGAIMVKVMGLEAAIENSRETILETRAEIDRLIAHASGQETGERSQQYGLSGAKVFGGVT